MMHQEPLRPPGVVWFGLEKWGHVHGAPAFWERCENAEWGKAARWWRVKDATESEVAARFGPGTYRALWTPESRREKLGYSDPFDVKAPGESEEEEEEEEEDEEEEDDVEPAPPPQPVSSAPRRAQAPPGFEPIPPFRAAAVPNPPPMPVVGSQFADPQMNQVVTLFQLLRGDTLMFHQQLMHQQQMVMEAERQRSRETIAAYQVQMQMLEQVRVQALRSQRDAGHAQLAGALQEIAMRVDRLSEEHDAAGSLPLSENPTDGERLMRGAHAVVQAIVNSPMGEHIARALASKLGATLPPAVDHGPMAAEE